MKDIEEMIKRLQELPATERLLAYQVIVRNIYQAAESDYLGQFEIEAIIESALRFCSTDTPPAVR